MEEMCASRSSQLNGRGPRELAARRSNVSRSMNKLDPLFGESVPSPLPLIIF
jgi:hypothetical protein